MPRIGGCVVLLGLLLFPGCASPLGKPWGNNSLIPSGERVKWAAIRALTDPYTVIPATGAALFAVAPWDQSVSEWARENKPVFGSNSGAKRTGEALRNGTIAAAGLTLIATPSGQSPWNAMRKGKGAVVEAAGSFASQGIARWIKEETNVLRPNGKDDLSFPSVITAETASWAANGRRNLRAIPMRQEFRAAGEAYFAASTALVGWSRIENGAHWPSDILAGWALGNFTALFLHDVFLGPSWRDFTLGIAPGREQTQFNLTWNITL